MAGSAIWSIAAKPIHAGRGVTQLGAQGPALLGQRRVAPQYMQAPCHGMGFRKDESKINVDPTASTLRWGGFPGGQFRRGLRQQRRSFAQSMQGISTSPYGLQLGAILGDCCRVQFCLHAETPAGIFIFRKQILTLRDEKLCRCGCYHILVAFGGVRGSERGPDSN